MSNTVVLLIQISMRGFNKLARLVGLIKLPLNYKEMSYSHNKKL